MCFGRKRNLLTIVQELSLQKTQKVSLEFSNDSLDVRDSAEGWCETGHVLSCSHVLLGEHREAWRGGKRWATARSAVCFLGRRRDCFHLSSTQHPAVPSLGPRVGLTHLEPTTRLLPARDFIPSSEFASHSFRLYRQV